MIYPCLECECSKRLEVLYNTRHRWLVSEANKLTNNIEDAQDLVSTLYQYLMEKCNPKIFWEDSFNIFYCNKFIHSRFCNLAKKNKLNISTDVFEDFELESYDIEKDERFQKAYDEIINSIQELQKTKLWPKAKIFELYWNSDDTLEETSKKIGISKSTTFIAVKEIKKWLKNNIDNPNINKSNGKT